MNRSIACTLAGTATLALTATMVAGPAGAADRRVAPDPGPFAVGLTTTQRLVNFSVSNPGSTSLIGRITGLTNDARVIGIDYRVQNERLYGVGDQGGVYRLRTRDARAVKVGQLTVPLEGANFGVDFNPAADRLRITSDTGQNLRHDVNPGGATIVDTPLSYPPAAAPANGITASAYTNNDLAAGTATTLFDLDTALDQLAVQAPANSGQLSPTGLVNRAAGPTAGLDIRSDVRNGTTLGNRGYATMRTGGLYRMYAVSLFAGRVRSYGPFPARAQVSDIAVRLDKDDR